jgi:hypothetical protein
MGIHELVVFWVEKLKKQNNSGLFIYQKDMVIFKVRECGCSRMIVKQKVR